MAELMTVYTLKLTELESAALKKLCGGLNDQQFAAAGLSVDEIHIISDIWNLLPYNENE